MQGIHIRLQRIYKIALLALSLGVAAALPAGQQAFAQAGQDEAGRHMKLGWEAFERKDYQNARSEIERATKFRKDYPEAYLTLALIAWAEGRFGPAHDHLDRALKFRSGYAEAHYVRGRLYYEENKLDKSRAQAELAIKLNPGLFSVHALVADLELAEGRLDSGLESLERARAMAPTEFDRISRLKERLETLREYAAHQRESYSSKPGHTKARILNTPRVEYTKKASRNGVAGRIRVLVRINTEGRIDRTLFLTGLPDGLNVSALRAILDIKAEPAAIHGQPVPTWVSIWVDFSLR